MKAMRLFLIIPVLALFLSGCETDVKAPLADRSYPVVYCVLNKDDTAHYVRLTKTFSGPLDAVTMAQNPDSLYYKNARVFAEMTGTRVEMLPTKEIKRDPGLFFSDYSLLYKTTYRLCGWITIHIYLPDNMEVIGKTALMATPVFDAPDTSKKKVLSFFEQEPVRIVWNGVEDVCQTTVRFKYLENNGLRLDTCFVDWIRKSAAFAIMPNDYLDYLSHWIPDKPEVSYRKVLGFDILVSTGNGQMLDYLVFKDWSIDIKENPYSNLINAYGLIASRVNGALTDYQPNQRFIDTLAMSVLTKHLKFSRW